MVNVSFRPSRIMTVFAISSCVTSASAQDAPSVGLLYNTKEIHSLVYRCEPARGSTIECEFTQTAVRKKTKPEDLAARLKEARDEYRAGTALFSADDCKTSYEILDVLEGRKKPPKEDGLREMTNMQR